MKWIRSVGLETARFDGRFIIVTAFSCALIVSYHYYFQAPIDFFHPFLRNSTAEALSLYKYVFSHAGSFLVLFVVPLLFLVILNRFSSDRFSPLKYTFTLGDFRLGWKLVYFFRGYILIEASRIFGPNALAITLLPYIIMKFGKPPFEIYTAILVGLALGYMTIRTRSFWYAAGAHALLATMVDTWEYYGMVSGQ
ncbi:MAG: CPBP family intramembrane metalloprotease [Desulfatitalea sp.]|nr:CPBP family intramembrane metalloprotease [Desulfatitalea sp.]